MIPLNRALLGGVVLLTLNSVQAQTSANIYLQGGAQPGALACVACHGADGMGLAPAGFPRLAGISAEYLWDVAAYINTHERPQDPRLVEDSVEKTRLKYHANDGVNAYGQTINGVLIGVGTQ